MKSVAIIGAGLGGLSAGALLAKKGYNVSVLEQHSVVGGCATTFKRKGFTCEVGLHEMEGVYTDPELKKIFTMLDVYGNVKFVKVDEFFKITTKNGAFVMPCGVENAVDALCKKFPQEHYAIKRYFRLIRNISKCFDTMLSMNLWRMVTFPFWGHAVLRYKHLSVTEVFNKLFTDEELKLILNANVQYYNDSPDTLSFLLHAVAQYSYYNGGGYFIKGGSQKLSDYLAGIIKENGGRVLTGANVTRCKDRTLCFTHKNLSKSIDADIIVSNLSPEDTYRLFNEPYKETKELSDSLLSIYIGFDCNLKKLYGQNAYSHFIANTQRPFVFVDYSQIGAGLCDEDKTFGAVCCMDFLKEWQNLDHEEYRQKKRLLEEAVIKKLETFYPGIGKHIVFMECATAKTMQRYVKTPNATAYGYKPTPKQFFRVPKSASAKIDNLYFTGQWVMAGGFRPAVISGYLCFKEIEKRMK